MFLKFGGVLKVVSSMVLGGSVVAGTLLYNNPYVSSSVNQFFGSSSLVQYSELQEVEELPPQVELSTAEDIKIYAELRGCHFVSPDLDLSKISGDIKNKFRYYCKNGTLIKVESNDLLPKLNPNQFYDYESGQIKRVCSGWETITRFFGSSVACVYSSERLASERKRDRDPKWISEFYKRRGTYRVTVQ